ncbi:MAG: hypothetical protein P9L97_07600 [Candidatus Tenebribacter davisii]|nr:hypothetical protein [Candidatus Tenebribacter davisii]
MKKQMLLKNLNMFLFLSFIITALALIFYKFIPSKIQGNEFLYETHEIAGIVMIILGILHFILNFNWVKAVYFKKKKK